MMTMTVTVMMMMMMMMIMKSAKKHKRINKSIGCRLAWVRWPAAFARVVWAARPSLPHSSPNYLV